MDFHRTLARWAVPRASSAATRGPSGRSSVQECLPRRRAPIGGAACLYRRRPVRKTAAASHKGVHVSTDGELLKNHPLFLTDADVADADGIRKFCNIKTAWKA